MSAPRSSGRWSRGVAKVLSTTTYASAACAASMIGSRSAISSAGLVGDSSQTKAASSQARTVASVSLMSTSWVRRRPRASRSASAIVLPL